MIIVNVDNPLVELAMKMIGLRGLWCWGWVKGHYEGHTENFANMRKYFPITFWALVLSGLLSLIIDLTD